MTGTSAAIYATQVAKTTLYQEILNSNEQLNTLALSKRERTHTPLQTRSIIAEVALES